MRKRIPIFLSLLLAVLALWVSIAPSPLARQILDRFDNLGYDIQLRAFVLTQTHLPTTPIAIIDIDDQSLKAEGRWPWPRNKIATLVDKLQHDGAAVIVFDIFFGEKETNIAEQLLTFLEKKNELDPKFKVVLEKNSATFNNDSLLAEALSKIPTVLAIGFLPRPQKQNILPPPLMKLSTADLAQLNLLEMKGYISNIALLQNAAKNGGFINVYPGADGVIRHAPLIMEYNGAIYPSLALDAVLVFLNEQIKLITPIYNKLKKLEGVQVGASVIPTDAKGEVFIPFIGKSYTFPFFSATDVLQNKIAKDALLGKILFIGTSATGLGDLKPTSIENTFPGVEIQATLANGILLNNFSYKPAWTFGANLVIIFILGFLSAFLFPYFGPRLLSFIIIAFPILLLFINNLIWEKTGLILSLLMPVILVILIAFLNMIYGYLFETRRREQLKKMFGQYVPKKHIDKMLKLSGNYALGGEDREMSVLFADIRNFTTISEELSASELVIMLNTFFTPMTQIIFNHRGTIDKYIGDLIMAFWGAPLKDKHHSRHAIEAALEMQEKIKEMREMIAKHHWPEIRMGIGINSGVMSVGDMGSQFRRNYTVLGDPVNLASRVESLTKFYGVDIIVTEATQQNNSRFVFRMLDRVRVKGKNAAIGIYEVLGLKSALSAELEQELKQYHIALNAYFSQQWEMAYEMMQKLQVSNPQKKIYALYVERIQAFEENAPPAEWNGVYSHVVK